jgi:hypothetical protein
VTARPTRGPIFFPPSRCLPPRCQQPLVRSSHRLGSASRHTQRRASLLRSTLRNASRSAPQHRHAAQRTQRSTFRLSRHDHNQNHNHSSDPRDNPATTTRLLVTAHVAPGVPRLPRHTPPTPVTTHDGRLCFLPHVRPLLPRCVARPRHRPPVPQVHCICWFYGLPWLHCPVVAWFLCS